MSWRRADMAAVRLSRGSRFRATPVGLLVMSAHPSLRSPWPPGGDALRTVLRSQGEPIAPGNTRTAIHSSRKRPGLRIQIFEGVHWSGQGGRGREAHQQVAASTGWR